MSWRGWVSGRCWCWEGWEIGGRTALGSSSSSISGLFADALLIVDNSCVKCVIISEVCSSVASCSRKVKSNVNKLDKSRCDNNNYGEQSAEQDDVTLEHFRDTMSPALPIASDDGDIKYCSAPSIILAVVLECDEYCKNLCRAPHPYVAPMTSLPCMVPPCSYNSDAFMLTLLLQMPPMLRGRLSLTVISGNEDTDTTNKPAKTRRAPSPAHTIR